MQLTDIEQELLAGFIAKHWPDFIAFAAGAVPESTLHRLAEKFDLTSNKQADIKQL